MPDLVDFARDLALDTAANLKKHLDPVKAENAELRRRVAALEAKVALLSDRRIEQADEVEPIHECAWRQQGDGWSQ